jgi:hypothetical protein
MLTPDRMSRMRRTLLAIRDDHPTEIVIRRGAQTLAPQTVRIARLGGQGVERQSAAAGEVRGRVVVAGDTGLDIQPADRFTDGGILYQVTFVRPNRAVAIQAEAEAVE